MAEIDVSYSPDGWKDSADAVRVKMKNDGYISANMISRRYRLVGKTILRKLTKMALKGELSCVRVNYPDGNKWYYKLDELIEKWLIEPAGK